MESLQKAYESVEALRSADAGRYDFIERLLEQMKAVLLEKAKVEEKFEDLERVRDSYRQDLNSCRAELNNMKTSTARNPFVLVLVDGDAAPFRDDFVRAGIAGGESAARELRRSVIEHVTGILGLASNFEVTVRVYCKIQYLNKTYYRAGILQGENTLQAFVQGFNRVSALCECIDAGNDKEGADHKVQNTMKLFINNVHCKHIILCASQDDSYTAFLRQFIQTGKQAQGITLVESIPFPQNLADVASSFLGTKFPEVFRITKLMADGDSGRSDSTKNATYAGAAAQTIPAAHTAIPIRPAGAQSTIVARPVVTIFVNAADQRVDSKLPRHDAAIVGALQERKLCKQHYLSSCNFPSGKCVYNHDAKLGSVELVSLRFLARLSPCENGIYCRDSKCVAAHMCKYGAKCNDPKACRYPLAMHNLDTEGVRYVPALS